MRKKRVEKSVMERAERLERNAKLYEWTEKILESIVKKRYRGYKKIYESAGLSHDAAKEYVRRKIIPVLESYDGERPFQPLAVTAFENQMKNFLTFAIRRIKKQEDVLTSRLVSEKPVDPRTAAIRKETALVLKTALKKVNAPERSKRLFWEAYYELERNRSTVKELAEREGITPNSLRTAFFRIREQLRQNPEVKDLL
ncbi:MAG: hypothetical protein ABIH20_06960 [Candidatus Diapherotrites archaeon]